MPKVDVVDLNNQKVGELELSDEVFAAEVNEALLYEAVRQYMASARGGAAKTKTRHEVSGAGKKLWRQKGTGRARSGSIRSPLWRHGGTVHGPVPRDYGWDFPKKMRRNALKSLLAQKLRDGHLMCLEEFGVPSHKTAELKKAVEGRLGVKGKALLVPEDLERNLDLAARNNPLLKVVRALGMSVVDLLNHEMIIVSEPALKRLVEVLSR